MLTELLPCKQCGKPTNYRIRTGEPYCDASCANAPRKCAAHGSEYHARVAGVCEAYERGLREGADERYV